ncbi:3-dehydrosphinganine reductase TSC10B [Brassica rapa]|uniref:3-dehydrosphinganine reductase TSC10B n=1 Tax=Brassica campestris TaxID=3711 RepID=UPI00142E2EC9|nr:3-dehydrosphinganine reductase TSC10B [Brassica rapa]
MLDVNLLGSFNVIKAALPSMKGRGGPASISLVSSQAGHAEIYGDTAYSARKFGLQGLAQALQQEVISHDLHVSECLFCFLQTLTHLEQKKRPELTSIIASSGSIKTKEVAKICLDGIKTGKFTVTCHFIGYLLSIATSPMSPQRSFWLAFVEVIFGGLIRLVCFSNGVGITL